VEKLKRIGLGPLSVEVIPRGRYRLIEQREAEKLGKVEGEKKKEKGFNTEEEKRRRRGRTEERKTPV
jgi:hypothetical protein